MNKVTLPKVRLSYCHVFDKGSYEGKPNDKYSSKLLLSKAHTEVHEKVRQMCVSALIEKYGSKEKIPKAFKPWVAKESFGTHDRVSMKDGDASDNESDEGMWIISASNKMKPTTLDIDKSELSEDDGKLYSGSYADAIVSCWIQDNGYGKRINFNLLGLRHRDHGEPLGGGGGRASEDDFDDLDDVETVDDGDLDDMEL